MRKSLSYMCPTSYKAPIVRFHGWVHGPLIIPSLDGWAICSNTIFHQNSVPYPRNTKNKVPCQVTNWWRIRKARTHGEIEHFCRTRLNAITMRLTFLWVWNLAETGDLCLTFTFKGRLMVQQKLIQKLSCFSLQLTPDPRKTPAHSLSLSLSLKSGFQSRSGAEQQSWKAEYSQGLKPHKLKNTIAPKRRSYSQRSDVSLPDNLPSS